MDISSSGLLSNDVWGGGGAAGGGCKIVPGFDRGTFKRAPSWGVLNYYLQ